MGKDLDTKRLHPVNKTEAVTHIRQARAISFTILKKEQVEANRSSAIEYLFK